VADKPRTRPLAARGASYRQQRRGGLFRIFSACMIIARNGKRIVEVFLRSGMRDVFSCCAFLALPAVVGGVLQWLLFGNDPWEMRETSLGWPVLLFGASVLMWCVRDFYRIGRGNLAPWDPPKKLVGLYRFMRNPMYVGVLMWVAGWSLVAGSPLLAAYAGVLAIAFHLRVILYEEPTLARKFGVDWTQYRTSVNRWVPKPPSKPRVRSS
jgi:protein-S-isoprenylcysteine O-methyltransferase Ste14